MTESPCPNTVQIEAVYSTQGGIAENIYHVKGSGPVTDIELLMTRVAGIYETWENTFGRTLRHAQAELVLLRVRDIGMLGGAVAQKPEAIIGGVSGVALPDSVSVPVKWRTARSGRSFRGRTYTIGIAASMVTGDTVNADAAALFATRYDALRVALNAGDWTGTGIESGKMVLVRRHFNKVQLNPAETEEILGAAVVSPFLATRRTRLQGRHLKR